MHHRVLSIAAVVALSAATVNAPAVAEAGRPAATSLHWKPCAASELAGYDCASLAVPRDWARPALGTITVAMVRHRSTGTARQRIGSLFMNPGGPGGSGLDTIGAAWGFLPRAVRDRFDLVSWDPRGLGASTSLVGCTSATWTPPPATGPVTWPAVAAGARAAVAAANSDCAAKNPDLAPYLGTRQVVRDLDAMRAAVGDTRLNFWAWSYGTRIAYVYALTFPGRLRALLLDGSIDPHDSLAGFSAGYDTSADAALGLLFQLYPATAVQYRRIMARLEQAPLRIDPQRTFTRWDLGRFLEEYAQWETLYGPVASVVKDVDTALYGSPATQQQAKARLRRLDPLPYDAMSGIQAIVQCLDYADRPTAAELDAAAARDRVIAPITGWYRSISVAAPCEGLTLAPDPVPTGVPVDWGARLLLIGATMDGQTPYVWTTRMASMFRSARVVTYVGSKHVTFGAAGSRCIDTPAVAFLLTTRLPTVNLTCPNVGVRPDRR